MMGAPICEMIQDLKDVLSAVSRQFIFNVEHDATLVYSDNDPISFELAQMLRRYLF